VNEHPRLKDGERADICLLLEGTYPYVKGGVSGWVHQLISGLPELRFAVIFLGGRATQYRHMQYHLPDNLVHLDEHYLLEAVRPQQARSRRGNPQAFRLARELIERLADNTRAIPRAELSRVLDLVGRHDGLNHADLLHSRAAWDALCAYYRDHCTDPSFVDFFWTARTLLAPLFVVATAAAGAPPANVYHAVSTGYAGFLGTLLRYRHGRPFVLSEHGIYTKERKIDLARSNWIAEPEEPFGGGLDEDVGYIRRMWIGFFEGLGRLTYDAADPVIALFEDNRERQIRDGAERTRTTIVPNGIDVEAYASTRLQHHKMQPEPLVALVGRVVPIKDIKTFIRSMRVVCSEMLEARAWVVGPQDEDPDYVEECRALIHDLQLEGRVELRDYMPMTEILPQISVLVLTSISEALPLVLLEGFAAGVPAVSSDVGACRELIEGRSDEDRALGEAGAVVPIASPSRTAAAVLDLLDDAGRWHSASLAGYNRVRLYYTEQRMLSDYRDIYRRALGRSAAHSPVRRALLERLGQWRGTGADPGAAAGAEEG